MSPDPHLITARSSPCPPLPLLFYCFSPFLSSPSISFAFPLFTSVSLFLSVRVSLIYHLCYVPPSIFPFTFSSEFLSRCLRFGSLRPPCIYYPSFISSRYSSFHLIPSSSLPVIVSIPRTVSVSFLASSPPLCRLSSVASSIPRVPRSFTRVDIYLEFSDT